MFEGFDDLHLDISIGKIQYIGYLQLGSCPCSFCVLSSEVSVPSCILVRMSRAVGDAICACRKNKNISQEVLSGLADIGRTHLSAIERGERKPTLETLYRISLALDRKMSDVVREIEKRL